MKYFTKIAKKYSHRQVKKEKEKAIGELTSRTLSPQDLSYRLNSSDRDIKKLVDSHPNNKAAKDYYIGIKTPKTMNSYNIADEGGDGHTYIIKDDKNQHYYTDNDTVQTIKKTKHKTFKSMFPKEDT